MLKEDNKNITIGLLIPNLGHYYTRKLWFEIHKYIDYIGCNLLVFSGHPLSSKNANYDHNNLIFTLPKSTLLDGVIFTTPSIISRISKDEFYEFRKIFNDIPNISIGNELDDSYNIIISNEISSKNIINHLIIDHGFDDIAYISGPLKNQEAVSRKNGYISALNENGISIDDNKIIESKFHWIYGEKAANIIIDNSPVLPQAIACGDDDIAIGVCTALKNRGINVPTDVAVIGFDNS